MHSEQSTTGMRRGNGWIRLRRVRKLPVMIIFIILLCALSLLFLPTWFTRGASYGTICPVDRSFVSFISIMLFIPIVGVALLILSIKSLLSEAAAGHYNVEISAAAFVPGSLLRVNYTFSKSSAEHKKLFFAIVQTANEKDGDYPVVCESDVFTAETPESLLQGTFVCTIPPAIEGYLVTWQLVVRHGKAKDVFALPGRLVKTKQ